MPGSEFVIATLLSRVGERGCVRLGLCCLGDAPCFVDLSAFSFRRRSATSKERAELSNPESANSNSTEVESKAGKLGRLVAAMSELGSEGGANNSGVDRDRWIVKESSTAPRAMVRVELLMSSRQIMRKEPGSKDCTKTWNWDN